MLCHPGTCLVSAYGEQMHCGPAGGGPVGGGPAGGGPAAAESVRPVMPVPCLLETRVQWPAAAPERCIAHSASHSASTPR